MIVTMPDLAAFVGFVLSVLALGTTVYNSATRYARLEAKVPRDLEARLVKLELKADTMWEFQVRRGVVEAVQHNLADLE